MMNKTSTLFLVMMIISSLSLWGCSNQKNGATIAKIRDLENRYGKLEEDYRVILATNEGNRRKLILLENQRAELTQKIEELQVIVKERDELKTQLSTRTEERDHAQAQFLQFTRDLQALAGRAQAAAVQTQAHNVSAVSTSLRNE
jgi:predicted mannosyl-3-phosphoglycerate phosphatase (HAD superfamily)